MIKLKKNSIISYLNEILSCLNKMSKLIHNTSFKRDIMFFYFIIIIFFFFNFLSDFLGLISFLIFLF